MDTRAIMSRRAAIKGAIIAAAVPTVASATPETSQEKITCLTEELRQAVCQLQGGEWKADLCMDVGMIVVRIAA